jgi:AAA domain
MSWEPLNIIELAANPPSPPEVAGLFYVGRRHVVSGEFESGKSWLALAAAADELKAGHGVVWVDADAMGAGDILERLRCLGVSDDAIVARFAYIEPDEASTADDRAALTEWAERHDCRLALLDAFNPILAVHGLDLMSNTDVERFYTTVVDRLCDAGCAVVLLDHRVKNPDASKRYSIGSERKASGAEVHISMVTIGEGFGRGKVGRSKLLVQKDRPGYLTRPCHGILVIDSHPEDGSCSWRIESDGATAPSGVWAPTELMERVSRYLELHPDGQSRHAIEDAVKGKADYLRKAIDALIAESYAVGFDGARGAKMVKLVTAYRRVEAAA